MRVRVHEPQGFAPAVSLTEHPAHAMNRPRPHDVQQEARWEAKRAVP